MCAHVYTAQQCLTFSSFSLDNTFEVKLFKNSSGLGFSFSREDNLTPEQINGSIVRVKKLFPGQPAAESGKIEVGDVILKVNGAALKGLSQQVSRSRRRCKGSVIGGRARGRALGFLWLHSILLPHLSLCPVPAGRYICSQGNRSRSVLAPLQTCTRRAT